MIALVIYLAGIVPAIVAAAKIIETELGSPLHSADVGAALFFAAGWPILAPFACVIWAAGRLLPLLGIEVKR